MKLQATLGERGQLILPAAVRRALGLRPGDRVSFCETEPGAFVLTGRMAAERRAAGLAELEEEAAENAKRRALSRAARAVSALAALRGGALGGGGDPLEGVPG